MAVLKGDWEPGLYRVTAAVDLADLAAFCQAEQMQLFVLPGSAIASKVDLLQTCAEIMHFPDYFGYNWDAFEDCLTDFEWLPAQGYVLFYDQPETFAQADPEDWATLMDILEFAVDSWAQTSSPLYVFFRTMQPIGTAIADLP